MLKAGEASQLSEERKALTVRGASGAVLALVPIEEEPAEVIGDAFRSAFTPAQRDQVRFLAPDDPSNRLWINLRGVLPNLACVT